MIPVTRLTERIAQYFIVIEWLYGWILNAFLQNFRLENEGEGEYGGK